MCNFPFWELTSSTIRHVYLPPQSPLLCFFVTNKALSIYKQARNLISRVCHEGYQKCNIIIKMNFTLTLIKWKPQDVPTHCERWASWASLMCINKVATPKAFTIRSGFHIITSVDPRAWTSGMKTERIIPFNNTFRVWSLSITRYIEQLEKP